MTPAELTQVEAAKKALGKATPGSWMADIRSGCLAVYQESKQDQTPGCHRDDERNIYYSNKGAFFNGLHWTMDEQARIDATLIAAVPVLTRRVIELEAEVQRLKDWQERAVKWLHTASKDRLRGVKMCQKNNPGGDIIFSIEEEISKITALITEVQGGGDGSH